MGRRRRPAGRRLTVSPQPVRHLSAGPAPLPQPEGQAEILPRGRSCAPADPANSRPAQALGPLGGPLCHQQSLRQRLLLPDRRAEAEGTKERRLRQRVGTTMERQPPPKILQLKCSMYHANFCTKYETIGPPRRARGLADWSYIRSPTRSQTSSVLAPKPSLAKSRRSKNRLSGWQELKAGKDAHTKNG